MRYLITGANRGIGLAMSSILSARGDDVVATCRTTSSGLEALGVTVVTDVDVATEEGVATLVDAIAPTPPDVVILNAGILRRGGLSPLDIDGIREQFEVNALGPLRVVAALHDRLPAGGKIAIITSRMGSIADNTSGGAYGYRMSKAAVNIAGKSLAVDLARRGVAVAILHPGYVRTDMTSGSGYIDAATSAAGLIARIDALTPQTSGTFWHQDGTELPW